MDTIDFIQGINEKSENAWRYLYNHYYSPLCNYANGFIHVKEEAEDIVQILLLHLWESDLCFEDRNMLTHYLYKSVYTKSISYLREQKIKNEVFLHLDESYDDISEKEAIDRAIEEATIARFYELLEQLSSQQKEILMRTLQGEKVLQIANDMGLSYNSVKTYKKRAYAWLKSNIKNPKIFFITLILLYTIIVLKK